MKRKIAVLALLLCTAAATTPAQETSTAARQPLQTPLTPYENCRIDRAEMFSYTIRETATRRSRTDDWNYLPLDTFTEKTDGNVKSYEITVEFPSFWADRLITLHTEGARNSHTVKVNGHDAGSSRDSRMPSEFDITAFALRGANTITIEIPADTDEPESLLPDDRPDLAGCFVYSQPRTRILDYKVSAGISEEDGEGEFIVEITVENQHFGEERFGVGFDIFSPAGNLEEYGTKFIDLGGGESTTVTLTATIYGAGKRLWSAESPNVYSLTLFINKGGRILEYIPMNLGFGETTFSEGTVYRNGTAVSLKPAAFNASSPTQTRSDIQRLRKEGYNVVCPYYPQPYWFYDLCDEIGMYVAEQANINTGYGANDMRLGGTLSNDPAWLPEYLRRTQAAFYRVRNHPCIIAWGLGGKSGNGYNMYKTYDWLRAADPNRPIVYRDAQGEWNNDVKLYELIP